MRSAQGSPRGRAQPWRLLLIGAATTAGVFFCSELFSANTLGSAVIAGYLAYGVARLLDAQSLFRSKFYLSSIRWGWLGLLIVGLALVKIWQHRMATGSSEWDMPSLLRVLYRASACKPGVFIVANAAFFGPIVLLAMAMWSDVCSAGRSLGLGMTFCLGLALLSSADGEARHSINFIPVVAAALCAALHAKPWPTWCSWTVVAVALFLSKIWLPLEPNPDPTRAFEFPAQGLFMNLGPWMSWSMFWVQGVACIAAGALLTNLTRRRRFEG